jgi:N-sulfoglucosamine sulfohydrolase
MPVTRRSALASAVAPALVRGASTRPNILLVLSDDHSTPYLGCYGASWMSTPHLDAFAREGMRFDRAFTTAPQCVPSRTGIMTGRSPVAVRMGRFSSPLPADVITWPEALQSGGYFTGVCGRYYHLNGMIKPGAVTESIYRKHALRTWDRRVDYLDVSAQGQTPARFEEFLGKVPRNQPWFFWMNYSDPHHVWDKDAGRVDPAKIAVPPYLPDLAGVRDDLARYCGEVERMDGLFGAAMDVLRRHSLDENTLVLFMGDNGMAFPHGKGSLYDPGLNVPFIARWPGKVKPGSATRALISGEDLAPTAIEAAGLKAPAVMSGRSFLGQLTGAGGETRRHLFAARLHHGNSAFTAQTKASEFDLSRCVRSDRWKLIYNCTPHMEYWPVDSGRDPGWQQILEAHRAGKLSAEHERAYFGRPRPVLELYDLDRDPGELNNMAGKPELRETERELLIALQEKMIVDFDFLPPPMNE